MKAGLTLNALAQEITRQQDAKKDFRLATTKLLAMDDGTIEIGTEGNFTITENANSQISQRLKIPKQYFDRMKTKAPSLWANNVNHWFNNFPEMRMVRTLDGKIRAFLSNRYRIMDNLALMDSVLPVLAERKDLRIESCQVTEDNFYLKVFFDNLTREVTKSSQVNDLVKFGLLVANSEVGKGGLKVQPMSFRLVCTNGMISATSLRKNHIQGACDGLEGIVSMETQHLNNRAVFATVKDMISHNLKDSTISAELDRYNNAATNKIENDIIEVVEKTAKNFNINEAQTKNVLDHLIKGGDLSQWGLANAYTRTAEDIESYDEATRFEALGGKIINLKQTEWHQLAI